MREGCRLPELEPDLKNEYFDIDLKVRFGSVSNFLANIYGESTMAYKSTYNIRYLREGEQEAPAYTTAQYDDLWELESLIVGDRTHPSSKPIQISYVYFNQSKSNWIDFSRFALLVYPHDNGWTCNLGASGQHDWSCLSFDSQIARYLSIWLWHEHPTHSNTLDPITPDSVDHGSNRYHLPSGG